MSGTIGDGALGLRAARGQLASPALERRYRLPQPRTSLGPRLVGIATAAADISDGLLADAGHIADASRLAIVIERDHVPLSTSARRAVHADPDLWPEILGGGDDYELVFAAPPRKRRALMRAADAAGVPLSRIGTLGEGRGVRLTIAGRPARAERKGYVHF